MRRSIQQRSCKLVVEFFPRLRNQSRLTGWFMVCQTRNPNPISRLIGPRGAGPTIYIPYSFPAETLKARVYNNVCTVLLAEKLGSHTISTVVSTPCPDPYLCLSFQSGLIVSGWRTTVDPSLEKVLLIRVVFLIRAFSCNLWLHEEIKED